MTAATGNQSPLDRAFSVLNFVASQVKAVAIAEVAEALDLPLPTAHRLVGNLEERQLIQRAPGTKRYVVGNELVSLAGKTISSAFKTARRHAVLQKVSTEIGEQCEIGIVRNNAVAYVDSVKVITPQGLQFDPGHSAPLHCTSTGKVYMSLLPSRARINLVRSLQMTAYTESTITDPQELLEVLKGARKSGRDGSTIRDVLAAQPDLSPSLIAFTADPALMTAPTDRCDHP